jgi:uncharacterized protein involved in cysteine biosynthesis
MRAAVLGLPLGIQDRAVRRSYGRLLAAVILISLALDGAGIAGIVSWTAIGPQTPWWVALSLLAVRWLGIAALLLATPLLMLVTTRVALPLLAEGVFLAGLRTLDPERARTLQQHPSLPPWKVALDALVRLARFAGLTGMLLLVALLIPGVGAAIAAPLQLYFTARALAWELLDPYFGRSGLRLRAQRDFVAQHRPALIGFGLPLALLLATPVLGTLLFGLAQAAAARLVHDAFREAPVERA